MTRSRWWRRAHGSPVIHPGEKGIIVMPTSTGTVDVANFASSGPPAASAEVERLREALEDVLNHYVLSDMPESVVVDRAVQLLDEMRDANA
jgi:hypothetical protein